MEAPQVPHTRLRRLADPRIMVKDVLTPEGQYGEVVLQHWPGWTPELTECLTDDSRARRGTAKHSEQQPVRAF